MKSVFYIVLASVLAVPLTGVIPLKGVDIWYVQYLALFSVFCLGISTVLWKFNKYLSLLTVLMWFSTIFVAHQYPRAIYCLVQFDLASLAAYAISTFTSKQRKSLLYVILVLFFIQTLWIVLQAFHLDPLFKKVGTMYLSDTVAFSASHNQASAFFADTAVLVAHFMPWMIPLTVFCLLKTMTAIGVIAASISVLIYLFIVNRKFFVVALASTIILCSFYLKFCDPISYMKMYERFTVAYYSVQAVEQEKIVCVNQGRLFNVTCNKWLGYGLGNFTRISPISQHQYLEYGILNHRYEHAHNDFIEAYFELGRLGFILSVLLVVSFVISFLRAKKTVLLTMLFCAVLAHLICANAVYTVNTAVTGMMLMLFYGLYRGELRDGQSPQLG